MSLGYKDIILSRFQRPIVKKKIPHQQHHLKSIKKRGINWGWERRGRRRGRRMIAARKILLRSRERRKSLSQQREF